MKISSNSLSILGGKKVIKKKFSRYNTIGIEEYKAAKKVLKSGILSKFLGSWGEGFYGGEQVQKFERECESFFKVKHAVTVNSWTSGLIAAVGSIGLEPGDEVIVTPFTMCATVTSILHWNAIPVFADIDPKTFNICPNSILKNISNKTKAIMAADILGQSCEIDSIMKIAKKYNLKVITDSAQSPGVLNNNRITGTLADVGGFSLNYHKHIHTGEGGILVTNNFKIYERLLLIRNHAEAAVVGKKEKDISNMIGYNFRMGEIEAAIGIEQLKKLDYLVKNRQEVANKLTDGIKDLVGLRTPFIKEGNTHAFYVYPIVLDIKKIGISRKIIVEALHSEGLDGISGGFSNIHLLPMFQKKIAYGSRGFPWTSDICKRPINYKKGICPIAEELHENTFIQFEMCLFEMNKNEIKQTIQCFRKVWKNLNQLRSIDEK